MYDGAVVPGTERVGFRAEKKQLVHGLRIPWLKNIRKDPKEETSEEEGGRHQEQGGPNDPLVICPHGTCGR